MEKSSDETEIPRLRKLAELELYGPIAVRLAVRARVRTTLRGQIVLFHVPRED